MIITNNAPPPTTVDFATLAGGDGFVWGGGNVAFIKTATGSAQRLGDGVVEPTIVDGVQVEPAANATVSMFPSS